MWLLFSLNSHDAAKNASSGWWPTHPGNAHRDKCFITAYACLTPSSHAPWARSPSYRRGSHVPRALRMLPAASGGCHRAIGAAQGDPRSTRCATAATEGPSAEPGTSRRVLPRGLREVSLGLQSHPSLQASGKGGDIPGGGSVSGPKARVLLETRRSGDSGDLHAPCLKLDPVPY